MHSSRGADRSDGDAWVTADVLVQAGKRVVHYIDGLPVIEYGDITYGGGNVNGHDPAQKPDGMPLERGYIALQSEAIQFEFRRVELLNLEGVRNSVAETPCTMKPMHCPKLMPGVVAIGLFPKRRNGRRRALRARRRAYDDRVHGRARRLREDAGPFLRASGGYTFDDETGTLSSLRVVIATESVDSITRRATSICAAASSWTWRSTPR